MSNKIKNVKKVLFIKLGEKGKFEEDCIEKSNTLKLDYTEIDHNACTNGNWDKVREHYLIKGNKPQVATGHVNQIKRFYEEDKKTLWITFYSNKLWWCFSTPKITKLHDSTKTRPVIGKWSDKDINGKKLSFDKLSGKLLKTQGFRGTICEVPEKEYVLAKINSEKNQDVLDVEKAVSVLQSKLTKLIQTLHWKDFETLVDLIFRQAGWQRVSEVGKTQKTLDLDLFAPVTGERALVQIKAQSKFSEFEEYKKDFENMSSFNKFFYVVHTSDEKLKSYKNVGNINIWLIEKVAELTISAGLVDWVIKKTS